jgi:carbamoylphosphate synthase large subunit
MELDCAYADLIHHFRFPNAGAQGRVSELMDKHYQMDLAKKFGLRVLESEYTNAVDFSLERVKYPCLIKPLNSTTGSKGDMHVCSRLEELKSALSTATETQDFIVQQYIRNEGDILCLGMSFANGDVWLPAVVFKPGVSAVGEYTHAVVSTDVRKYLPEYEAVQRFVKATKYVGPFSVEFGLEQGKNYFFEINLRNDGTSHYPLKAHVNLIQSYIEETHVRTLPIVEYNMVDEVGDLRRVLLHELSLYQWWKNFCAAGSYRFYSDKDWTLILPLMSMFLKRSFSKLTNSRR